jgi:hypothetical protein
MAPRMLGNGVIKRWIKFIEKNPNLTVDNYTEAKGIVYRGIEVLPWSTRSRSLIGASIRTRQCYYWTLRGDSIVDCDTTEDDVRVVLMYVQIELSKHVLKNPDDSVVNTKQISEIIQAITRLNWVNL